MNSFANDTIVAPATPPGVGGVAVVRVSGQKVPAIAELLFSRGAQLLKKPGALLLGDIFSLKNCGEQTTIDRGLAVYFAAPASFTGEDVLEFHIHGGPYLTNHMVESVLACGARVARPGEFSERAFLQGKIDLTQAEAIADLINAETAAQAAVANEQLAGRFSSAVSKLGEPLRDCLAHIEATIDFPEEDIEPKTYVSWGETLSSVSETLGEYIDSYRIGRVLRDGAKVVLAGFPNAGKSSLLNALVGENRVIVTAIPGTTRDAVDVRMSLDGVSVSFWDTAGLLETAAKREIDEVERFGIERSWEHIRAADLVLFVVDVTADLERARAQCAEIAEAARVLLVANKTDLISSNVAAIGELFSLPVHGVSAATGEGIVALQAALREALISQGNESHRVLVTTRRHVEAIRNAHEAVERARGAIISQLPAELIAADVRMALTSLDEIIGVTPTEEILGRIFSTFCIGK